MPSKVHVLEPVKKEAQYNIFNQEALCGGDGCGCGHDQAHGCYAGAMPDDSCGEQVYILENLGCANCAAKMEAKIKELEGVRNCSITYTTKQLRLYAEKHSGLLSAIEKICDAIEPGVKVALRVKSPASGKMGAYLLENLGCANCADKMERQISQLPQVSDCSITFATKQLRVTAADPDGLIPRIQEICSAIEPGIRVVKKEGAKARQAGMAGRRKDLAVICAGGLLLIGGKVCEGVLPMLAPFVYLVGYALLAAGILVKAGKNLLRGQIFDENFLMSVATLGALAIGEFPEALGVILFYRVGEYFEARAVEKSRGQIMDAVDLRPDVVNLMTGEEVRVIDARDAQAGDILLVRPGDRVPLDGVVVDGESRIDTSPVTGEPVPVKVALGSEVLSGCINTSGVLKMRVEKVLEESMVTRILDSVENAAAQKPKMDRFITRFARIYTPIVLALALCVAVIPSLVLGNWQYWIYTALTFLVISCPCALVLSVPLAFFSGIGAGSRKGILFKGGITLESLKNVRAVVMDKTGTITKGNFAVQKILPYGETGESGLLALAASCELGSTHPIAGSVVEEAKARGLELRRSTGAEEIAGHGVVARLPQGEALCGNRELLESRGVAIPADVDTGADTGVLVALNGEFAGYLIIADTIKEDARGAVAEMKRQGVLTAMLTGDSRGRAQAVAEAVGVDEVYAELLPEDKVGKLGMIRASRSSVMFVGDGINDAPVLASADVGAAMGTGADAAIEVADVVFMTSSLQAVPQSFAIARATCRIAAQNVIFALAVKVIVMALGLAGFASMWMAVFADTGISLLCVLNSIRILYK